MHLLLLCILNRYSLDEGENWHDYKIVEDPIFVYGLLTEPGENTTIFSVFGSQLGHHSWVIIQVDFQNAFEGEVYSCYTFQSFVKYRFCTNVLPESSLFNSEPADIFLKIYSLDFFSMPMHVYLTIYKTNKISWDKFKRK